MTEVTKKARGRPPARALTKKQKTFAELYVWERGNKNNTQCAFEAGYKTRATKAASDLLNRRMYPLVGEYIEQLEKEQELRFRINKSIHMQDLGKIKNVSIMKIDVEGHELNALMGAKKTILQSQPVIVLEVWRKRGKRLENIKSFLKSIS